MAEQRHRLLHRPSKEAKTNSFMGMWRETLVLKDCIKAYKNLSMISAKVLKVSKPGALTLQLLVLTLIEI